MARPYGLLRAGFPYFKTIGQFTNTSSAFDVAFGQEGRIFVLCGGNSGPISIVDIDDEDLGSFGAPGFGFRRPSHKCNQGIQDWPIQDGALMWPVQILVDQEELIYVSDEATDRVSIFNRAGEFLGKWGEHGSEPGQFDRPSGIAFDADENMLVVDTMNHRVQKFTKDGRFINAWGAFGDGPGQFNMPWGIHVDELGDVYIADWRNNRVQKLTAEGEFIFQLGHVGNGDGEFDRPAGVAVDRDGDIYVADYGNDRVQLFDHEGTYIDKFIGDATLSKSTLARAMTRNARYQRIHSMANHELEKRFRHPRSVRVDDEGHMFVPDDRDCRIQVYKKEAYPLTEEEMAPPLRAPTLTLA